MSSGNFKDLTPDNNYASVELTGDSIVLPPDAEDVILVVEGDSSISGTVNVELEHSNDNVNFTTAKNKPVGAGAASTYTLSAFSQVLEGGSITVNLSTTGVDEGILIPYTITGIQAADLTSGSLTGNIEVGATGSGSVVLQPVEDFVAESETMTVTIGSSSNTLDSIDIDILDTTYAITPVSSSVNEGSTLVFNVATTNVADGTTLYFTIDHGTTEAADFVAESGSFTITSNAGSFSVQTVADVTTEGSQTFTTQVRVGSVSGTVAATSSTITINDTSLSESVGNEFFLNGESTNTTQDDFKLTATNKSLVPTYGGTTFPNPGGDAFSFSFWFKTQTSSASSQIVIWAMNSSTTGIGISLKAINGSTPRIAMDVCSSLSNRVIANQSIPASTVNDWNHYTFVMHSGSMTSTNLPLVSVNGGTLTMMTLGNSAGTLSQTTLATLSIGTTMFSGISYSSTTGSSVTRDTSHTIDVDELAFYSKRLSQSESDAVYNSGDWHNLDDLAASYNLVRYFRMGDGTNDNVAASEVHDIKNASDKIEKNVAGSHGVAQLTMNDAPYHSPTNEYYLGGQAQTTQQDDYSINGSEKSLFPSKGGGSNYFPAIDDEWSLSFWFKGNINPGNYVPIFQMVDSNNTQIKMFNGTLSFNASSNARSCTLSYTKSNVFNGKWTHIVITKSTSDISSSSIKLYANGSEKGLNGSSSLLASDFEDKTISKTTFAGALVSAVSGNFLSRSSHKIDIDQIRSWDVELTSTQVTELYNSGAPKSTSDLNFASNIDAEFLCGDGSNDDVDNNKTYDEQDSSRYIEKVGTGTFGISEH